MTESIFVVPLAALAIFLVFGNENRRRILAVLPFLSMAVIAWVGGWQTLATALVFVSVPAALAGLAAVTLPGRAESWRIRLLAVLVCLGLFVFLKDYFDVAMLLLPEAGEAWFVQLVSALGLSFLVFRVIEAMVIAPPKGHEALGLGARAHRYLSFTLAFPAFFSGPVTRWRDFLTETAADAPVFEDSADMMASLDRVATGILIMGVLSQPFLLVFLAADRGLAGANLAEAELLGALGLIGVLSVFYLAFLFWNFSAFTDIMIGSGRFLGLTLPENFRQPFVAQNLQEFFARWHMSVSQWFRDLVFTPVVSLMIRRGVRSNTFCAATGFFLSFGLLGIWHGRTWPFILCGLMLGVGALCVQIYRDLYRKRVNRWLGPGSARHRLVALFLQAATFYYIGISVLGLWLNAGTIGFFLRNLARWEFAAASLGIIFATMAVILLGRWVAERLPARVAWDRPGSAGHGARIAAKCLVGVGVWLIFAQVDESSFVYQGF